MSDNTPWPDDRKALVRRHCEQGLSPAESARLIGGTTRVAIIGQRYRMGLCKPKTERAMARFGRTTPASPRALRVLTKDETPVTIRVSSDGKNTFVMPPSVPLPEPVAVTPGACAKPWIDRRFGECWYLLGEGPDALACCARVTRGGLCATHYRLCHQPATGHLKAAEKHPGKNRAAAVR